MSETMSPVQRQAGLTLAGEAMKAEAAGDYLTALRLAQQGQVEYPGLSISQKAGDGTVTTLEPFKVLAERAQAGIAAQGQASQAVEAAAQVLAQPQVTAEPVSAVQQVGAAAPAAPVAPGVAVIDVTAALQQAAAPAPAAPAAAPAPAEGSLEWMKTVSYEKAVQVAYFAGPAINGPSHGKLVIRHSAEKGTWVEGTAKDDGTWPVMKSKGQRWGYARGTQVYYLVGSRGFEEDMPRICWAALALRLAGWDVEIVIDRKGCKQKKYTSSTRAARFSRLMEVKRNALGQQRVEPTPDGADEDDADEPVSAPPATPVSAVPAPVSAVPAPVSAVPVSHMAPPPAPPVSAPPAQPAAVLSYDAMSQEELTMRSLSGDAAAALALVRLITGAVAPQPEPVDPFDGMSMAELLDAFANGVPGAKDEVLKRAAQPTPAPVQAPTMAPAPVQVSTMAPAPAARPVSAPPARRARAERKAEPGESRLPSGAPVPVPVLGEDGNTYVYYAVKTSAALRATRTAFNQALGYWLNRVGEKNDRPAVMVTTLRAERAFRVLIERVPASADLDAVLAAIGVAAQRAAGDGLGVNLPESPEVDHEDEDLFEQV